MDGFPFVNWSPPTFPFLGKIWIFSVFCKGLDSGYRPIRRRLPHESEQSCSAIKKLTVSKLGMRFDIIIIRRGTIDLATLDSQRHSRKKGASKVRDSFGTVFYKGRLRCMLAWTIWICIRDLDFNPPKEGMEAWAQSTSGRTYDFNIPRLEFRRWTTSISDHTRG